MDMATQGEHLQQLLLHCYYKLVLLLLWLL